MNITDTGSLLIPTDRIFIPSTKISSPIIAEETNISAEWISELFFYLRAGKEFKVRELIDLKLRVEFSWEGRQIPQEKIFIILGISLLFNTEFIFYCKNFLHLKTNFDYFLILYWVI